jgi:hypothetical protein
VRRCHARLSAFPDNARAGAPCPTAPVGSGAIEAVEAGAFEIGVALESEGPFTLACFTGFYRLVPCSADLGNSPGQRWASTSPVYGSIVRSQTRPISSRVGPFRKVKAARRGRSSSEVSPRLPRAAACRRRRSSCQCEGFERRLRVLPGLQGCGEGFEICCAANGAFHSD